MKTHIKTIFVCPTEMELKAVGADFLCGVGAVESAANLAHIILDYRPERVVLAGIAGAIDKSLEIGDVVAVSSETTADTGVFRGAEFKPIFERKYVCADAEIASLRCVTSQSVNASCSPYTANEVQIENMEGASLFAVAQGLGVKFLEIRAISNSVGDHRDNWNIELALHKLSKEIQRLRDEFEH